MKPLADVELTIFHIGFLVVNAQGSGWCDKLGKRIMAMVNAPIAI